MNTYKVYFFILIELNRIYLFFLTEGNKKINRVRTRYGFEPLDESSMVLVNLSMTYAIVKILLPLRIGLSLMLTPWLASVITRSLSIFRRFKIKFFS